MILRRVGGVLAGAIVANLTILAVQFGAHQALGTAAGPSPAEATLAMKVMVVVAWTLGALAGGLVAAAIARWRVAPWIVGALVAVGVLLNQLNVPTPLWMSAAGIALALLAAAFAASRVPADQRVAL